MSATLEFLWYGRGSKATFVLLVSYSLGDNSGMRRSCRQIASFPARSGLRGRPAGLSLLEVLLAFVFLTCALAAVGQRVFVGMMSATRLQQETEAAIRCESMLGMMLSGAQHYQKSGMWPDDQRWRWSSNLTPSSVSGMLQLTVSVWHSDPNRKFARCSLTRLVRSNFADIGKQSAVTREEGQLR